MKTQKAKLDSIFAKLDNALRAKVEKEKASKNKNNKKD